MYKITLLALNFMEKGTPELAMHLLKAFFLKYSSYKSFVEIQILQFSKNTKKEVIIQKILETNPNLIGFSCYMWNINIILEVSKLIKENHKGIEIVLGGPEVSPQDEEILSKNKFIDYIIRGEGEESFKELVECIIEKKCMSCVSGLSYNQEGTIFINSKRTVIKDLDDIPSPYLEGVITQSKYFEKTACLETMRGCPFKCAFCYDYKDYEGMRYHSLRRIEDEFKFILKRAPKFLYIMDPTFNANTKRAKEILRLFIKYNKNTKLHVELKAELLDEEMIFLLDKANSVAIEIGLQTINSKTLKLINRHFDSNRFKENLKLLKRYEQKRNFLISIIYSLPFEGYNDLKNSVDYAISLQPSSISLFKLSVIPGTVLWKDSKKLSLDYEKNSPYYVIREDEEYNKNVSFLVFGVLTIYNNQLLRKTLLYLYEQHNIAPSEILEEFFVFVKECYNKNDNINSLIPIDFAKHIVQERNLDDLEIVRIVRAECLDIIKKFNIDINHLILYNLSTFEKDGIQNLPYSYLQFK